MVILPLLIGSLISLSSFNAPLKAGYDYKSVLTTSVNERGNYTLNSVKSIFSGSELRIYHYDDMLIDEVSDNAFSGTNFDSLMLSNSVTTIHDAAFDNAPNIKYLYFTGSEEEYSSLGLTHEFSQISYYSKDEGFLNFWNKEIRLTSETNICDISNTKFTYIYSLYKNLSPEDLEVVDAYQDLSNSSIKDSMKELIRVFTKPSPSQKSDEWNQTGAITLIIFIAVLGMTSITVFFLLKTKHIID